MITGRTVIKTKSSSRILRCSVTSTDCLCMPIRCPSLFFVFVDGPTDHTTYAYASFIVGLEVLKARRDQIDSCFLVARIDSGVRDLPLTHRHKASSDVPIHRSLAITVATALGHFRLLGGGPSSEVHNSTPPNPQRNNTVGLRK